MRLNKHDKLENNNYFKHLCQSLHNGEYIKNNDYIDNVDKLSRVPKKTIDKNFLFVRRVRAFLLEKSSPPRQLRKFRLDGSGSKN